MSAPFDDGSIPPNPNETERPKRGKPRVVGGKDVSEPLQETDDALPAKYSEVAASEEFVRLHGERMRFVHKWGKWLEWDGKRWRMDETLLAFDIAKEVCKGIGHKALFDATISDSMKMRVRHAHNSAKTVAAVEKFARANRAIAATSEEWDTDLWSLNTPDGIIDLKTGNVRQNRQSERMTKITNVRPSLVMKCETWEKFLNTVTAGDVELQGFLQRIAGYSLTGTIDEHALFFLYGTGRNGKGTFLNMLTHIMGDYAKTSGMDVFIEKKNQNHPTEVASMMGARLVTAQETAQGKRWDETRIKAMTGGDPITARFMRMDEFTFMPQFKLVMAGNHKPRLRNVDEAMKARMNLVPFTVTIPPGERDKGLKDKLIGEAPAILQWMINGCLEWQDVGLKQPASVKQATEEYLTDQDALASWLAAECVIHPSYSESKPGLYKAYKAFTEAAGEYAQSSINWKDMMLSHEFKLGILGGTEIFKGVKLINNLI